MCSRPTQPFDEPTCSLDFTALSDAFSQWMAQQISPDEDCYAIDSKRINQPLVAEDGKTRFAGLVSVFEQTQGVTVEVEALAQQLQDLAKGVNLTLFCKQPRKKKTKKPIRVRAPKRPHISTAKLLSQQ